MKVLDRYITTKWQNRIGLIVQTICFVASMLFIGCAIIDYGFTLTTEEMTHIWSVYRFTQILFAIIFTLRLITNWQHIWRQSFVSTIVLGVLLYLSLLPDILPAADAPRWLARYYHAFDGKFYTFAIVALFALMEISKGFVGIIRRKTNPALLLASAFLVIIFFGTIVLMVPRSTVEGVSISMIDALFVSTSAVCVTGLTTVDIASTFSTEGLIVIALLIQVGGLGVMTITSFFALFFMGGTGLYDQFALRDMLGSDTLSSLMSTLLYILGFTIGIEAIGALAIWLSIHGTMGISASNELLFSIFHSISAFCNAGFSTLNNNLGNAMIIQNHGGFYLSISALIILGGIGFPILVNLKNALFYSVKYGYSTLIRRQKPTKYTHLAQLNTKIAVTMTLILLIGGTIAIAATEWNGAFAGMKFSDKLVHSIFNAVSPRTAGFNSVSLTNFSLLALIIYIILMWIGGASQSTAGGIKVNTLSVATASFLAVVRGDRSVTMFNREISNSSVLRAYATIFGSVMAILGCFVALVLLEPGLDVFDLFFETVSALSTVGSSLGVTPHLCTASKLLVSAMMFVGRVGLITVAMSIFARREKPHYRLPAGDVIIN